MPIEEKITSQQQRKLFFNRFLDALSKDDADDGTSATCVVVDAIELGDQTSIHVEGAGGVLLPLQKGQFRYYVWMGHCCNWKHVFISFYDLRRTAITSFTEILRKRGECLQL